MKMSRDKKVVDSVLNHNNEELGLNILNRQNVNNNVKRKAQ